MVKVFGNSGKKPCLGQIEFFIPEDEVGGDRTMPLKPADDDKSAQLAGYTSCHQCKSMMIVFDRRGYPYVPAIGYYLPDNIQLSM